MEGCFMFNGGVVFQMGGALFLSRGHPMGASVLIGGVFKKKCRMGGVPPNAPSPPLLWETLLSVDSLKRLRERYKQITFLWG